MIKSDTRTKVIYGATDRSAEPWWVQLDDWLIDHSGVKLRDKSLFYASLRTLVASGIRVVRALNMLGDRAKNKRLQRILHTVSYDMVEGGLSLSKAFSKYPSVFGASEVKMIMSAEMTGRIEETLESISAQIQKNLRLSLQVRSAMMYPLTVFGTLFLAGMVVMIFVVPQFESMFAQLGGELPMMTQVFIAMARFLQNFWWLVLAGMLAGWMLFLNWKSTTSGRYQWDSFVLSVPGVGSLAQNYQTIQIASNLSSLLESGISLDQALKILKQIVSNAVMKKSIARIEKSVRSGMLLHEAFGAEENIDSILSEVIEVGEQSHSIGLILQKTAEQYELQFDSDIKNISKIMEPVIIIVVAVAVVFMAMAILLPIFQMQDLMAGS
jgi:type II secretory pathway component PulF